MKRNHLLFPLLVIRSAWSVNRSLNFAVFVAVLISSVSAIAAPYVLGISVTLIGEATTHDEFNRALLIVASGYSALWLIGSTFSYLIYPLYGKLEQVVQSNVMAASLNDSLAASPAIRSRLDNSEIGFAIDTEAGGFRDTLSALYLSVLPAIISLLAGVVVLIHASTLTEGLILCGAMLMYGIVSWKLIDNHQTAQAAFLRRICVALGFSLIFLLCGKKLQSLKIGNM